MRTLLIKYEHKNQGEPIYLRQLESLPYFHSWEGTSGHKLPSDDFLFINNDVSNGQSNPS